MVRQLLERTAPQSDREPVAALGTSGRPDQYDSVPASRRLRRSAGDPRGRGEKSDAAPSSRSLNLNEAVLDQVLDHREHISLTAIRFHVVCVDDRVADVLHRDGDAKSRPDDAP